MSNYPLRLPETLMDDARNMAKLQGSPSISSSPP